jgi:uncharacterized lipoprotein YbaY
MRIDGQVAFTEILAPFSGATVIVKVEDVRYADAPAVVIAEQRISQVSRSPSNREPVPFSIECPVAEDLGAYALRVHVDIDASGDVSPGDYVSTQSYPLTGVPASGRLVVRVQPVR